MAEPKESTRRPRLLARLPLRFITLLLFLVPVLAASASLMTIGMLRGRQSTRELVMSSLRSSHTQVCLRLGDMLSTAGDINQLNANLLDEGKFAPDRPADWRRHLFGQARTFEPLSCISWDGADGREAWIARYPGASKYPYWFGLKEQGADRDVVERPYLRDGTLLDTPERRYDQDPRQFPPFQTGKAMADRRDTGAAWCPPFEWYDEAGKPVTFALACVQPYRAADGKLLGVLTAQLTLDDVSAFLATHEPDRQDRTFIIDHEGRLMGDSRRAALMDTMGRAVLARASSDAHVAGAAEWAAHPPPGADSFAVPNAGALDVAGVEYVAVVTPFTHETGITWRIVTVAPLDAYMATLSQGVREEAAVAGGIALATILLALLAAAVALRPLYRLLQHVQRIDGGDLDGRLEMDQSREFHRLASAMNVMTANLRERLELRRSLELAAHVQQGLLPSALPVVQGLDVAATAQYCDQTGGDYYDFPNVCGRTSATLPLVVGDVIGHGVPSAMLMAAARGIVRSTWQEPADLADILRRINAALCGEAGELSEGRFMTMLAAEIDPAQRRIRWASAGHDAPMVFDPARGAFRPWISAGGLPLGIAHPLDIDEATEDIAPGQVIVFGTDGVWETQNPAREQFGKHRLAETIRLHADRPADAICRAILDQLAVFRATQPLADDLTLVIVKVGD